MTTRRAVELTLMAVASFLLVPLCLAALGLVVWMSSDEM